MYALVAPILVFAGGAAIDYGRAAQIHTKLNAAADAAALAALTPSMLQQSTQTAHDASVAMFTGLTEGIPGLTTGATQVTVTVTVGSHRRSSVTSQSAIRVRSTPSSLRCSARAPWRFRASPRQARRRRPISTSTSCSTIRHRWRCRRRGRITLMQSLTKKTPEAAPSPAIRRIRATTRVRRQAARRIRSTILVQTARNPTLPSSAITIGAVSTRKPGATPPRATCSSTTMGLRARTTSRFASTN